KPKLKFTRHNITELIKKILERCRLAMAMSRGCTVGSLMYTCQESGRQSRARYYNQLEVAT
ncbi:unnamed protein product, partial [Brassica rapa subsp. trilocularis]